MALSAGSRLGPYEIVAPLGAGGMGEVYTITYTETATEGDIWLMRFDSGDRSATR